MKRKRSPVCVGGWGGVVEREKQREKRGEVRESEREVDKDNKEREHVGCGANFH